jgi:glycosyltransferase involved in cell wall biosynthesis
MLTNTVAPDSLGGLERYVRELAAHLVQLDCRVTVIAKRADPEHPARELAADGVHLLRYSVPSKKDPSFAVRYPYVVARAVRRALDEDSASRPGDGEQPVLHGHFAVPALVPALRRDPFLYTLHAPVWRELLSERQDSYVLPKPVQRAAVAGLRRAESLVVERARQILTLSQFMRQEVVGLDPAAGGRCEVVPGGVDIDLFAPGRPSPESWSDQIPGPTLFTARRLVPRTGVLQLVEAMPAVLEAFPTAKLAIAGVGAQESAIRQAIAARGLQDRVRLLGWVTTPVLVDWYRRASLVVTPTQELEGFGLATAEAMACGSVCLVTPTGANPEVVRPLAGDLVTSGTTPGELAAGVIRLLSNSERLDMLRSGARAAVAPALGWGRVAERHLEIYRTLAGGASHSRGGEAA